MTSTVIDGEAQPERTEKIVNVTVWSTLVILFKVPEIVELVPETAIPVTFTALLRVQPKVVPGVAFGFVIRIGVIALPLQSVCVAGDAATSGLGFTNTETVVVLLPQPPELAVMVNMVVCGTVVLLVKFPVMFVPLPPAAIPVRFTLLSRVHE